jgi:hypothetical protein
MIPYCEEKYDGKFLVNGSDCELFVLKQMGHFLFCLSWSNNHHALNSACYAIKEIEDFGYEVQTDWEPEWLTLEEISNAKENKNFW